MNDLSQDAWFYTQNGAKGGPVDFSTLLQMASSGKLHPRQDLIWSKGMERWQPAGEIQGLFERRVPVEAPLVAETATVSPARSAPPAETAADPYVAPEEVEAYDQTGQDEPVVGVRRRGYLFFLIVFPILWLAVIGFAVSTMGSKVPQETMALVISGLSLVPGLVGLYVTLMRFVNLGMSRWWFLGNFVPLLNFWVGYRCFACPSGYAVHQKMDRVGIFLAIIYWLLVLALVAAFGALVAIVIFDAGPPELRDQIVEAIRQGLNMPKKP